MKFSEFFTSKDNIYLDKKTLVILRWIAFTGQYTTISIVYFIFKFELHFFYCSLIIFIGVLTNLYLQFKFKKNQLNNFASTFCLFYDLIQLSFLLYLTGGITNPFIILIIVPSIVSATFLTLKSTINLSIITIIILFFLTIYKLPLPISDKQHLHLPDAYLIALPISIVITLIFLTYFGIRFGIERRKRTEALNKLELILAKEHELESIGLQAAAAAHSLGTPLSTITVIARELEKEIGDNPKYNQDISLLISQTKRCSEILKNLSQDKLKDDNFLSNINMWIGDAFGEKCVTTYREWRRRIESLQYFFREDCSSIMSDDSNEFNALFDVIDGQHPPILRYALANKINIETFIILDDILNFIPKFNRDLQDPIVWPDYYNRCVKYKPFFTHDLDTSKKSLKKVLDL